MMADNKRSISESPLFNMSDGFLWSGIRFRVSFETEVTTIELKSKKLKRQHDIKILTLGRREQYEVSSINNPSFKFSHGGSATRCKDLLL